MIKDVMTGTYTYNGEDFNFEFYTNLTASEKATFVAAVTSTLVGEDYQMVLRDMIFDYRIITMFTDVDMSFIGESEDSIDELENFLEETNIVDIVKVNVDPDLIDELNKAIDINIEYRTGIHKNILSESLSGLIGALEKKVNEIDITDALGMIKKLSGITEDFTPESIVKAYIESNTEKSK